MSRRRVTHQLLVHSYPQLQLVLVVTSLEHSVSYTTVMMERVLLLLLHLCHTCAGMGDLMDVLEIVEHVHDWSKLGMILGLLYQPTLTDIETHRRSKQDDCKRDMLSAWLQQQDNVTRKGVPSWNMLRAALKRMGEHELANRISITDGEL